MDKMWRRTLTIIFMMCLITIGESILMRRNVAFQRISEITSSRSSWTLTLINDITSFERISTKIAEAIKVAEWAAKIVENSINENRNPRMMDIIQHAKAGVDLLNRTRRVMYGNFAEHKHLQSRSQRSLLPGIGEAFGWLFGLSTDRDLSSIRKNIANLARNQKTISHVLTDSLSLLNVSRTEISENRDLINNLIRSMLDLEVKLENVTLSISQRVDELQQFTELYFQLDSAIQDIKFMTNRALDYVENLKIQLNFLSTGHLTTNTISPKKLKMVLLELKSHLPTTLRLPADVNNDLWYYYKYLTCNTVLDQHQILIIISIPLIEEQSTFEIFKAHNLPVPYISNNISDYAPILTAKYDLEASYLAINKQRTEYLLVTDEEKDQCRNHLSTFCNMKSPRYPINVSKFCIVALFMDDDRDIAKHCDVVVSSKSVIPMGIHVYAGKWLISTRETFDLSVLCSNPVEGNRISHVTRSLIKVRAPLQFIELEQSCSATSGFMTLEAFYSHSSTVILNPDELILPEVDVNVLRMWEPFVNQLPNFTEIELPEKLKSIKQINMNKMINTLKALRFQPEEVIPLWKDKKVLISSSVGLVLLGIIVALIYFRKRICNNCSQVVNRVVKKNVSGLDPDMRFEVVPLNDVNNMDNTEVVSLVNICKDNVEMEENSTTTKRNRLYPTLDLPTHL